MRNLFVEESPLALLKATQVFYKNVDLLHPGAEGDEQIRKVTEKLVDLDLLTPAAELLEHQVFHRLRGQEKAEVAIDLGEIYLADKDPNNALRVIQSTRITGLEPAVINRRREIEATSLWKTGRHDRALARLEVSGDQELPISAIYLKAMIEADMGDFKAASHTFYPFISKMLIDKEILEWQDEVILLQSISVFSQSGEGDKIDNIVSLLEAHHQESAVAKIAASLSDSGDFDAFYDSYRQWTEGLEI